MTDLRLAVRQHLRHPTPALAAVLSLALGIGANTAIFSVLEAVVLRPLPYAEADRLVAVWETSADNPARWVAPATFVDWRREATGTIAQWAAYDGYSAVLTGAQEPERLRAVSVSGTFFPLLGVRAAHGRALGPEDDAPAAACAAVLSDGLRGRRFGIGDPVGTVLTVDGRPCTIVGVLPPTFRFPLESDAELWVNGDRGVPRGFPFPGDITGVRDSHVLSVVARLRPQATAAAAEAELQSLMTQLAARYPDTNAGLGAAVRPLHAQVVGDVRPILLGLQLAVGLMLIVACVNVAHLLLGHAVSRQGEIATRAALGAGRGRLVRQLLAETLVLAVPGGVAGLLLAAWALDALVALAPPSIPRLDQVRLDPTVLAAAVVLTLGTAVAFGLGPALHLLRSGLAPASQRVVGGRGVRRWHQTLVVGELAASQGLLVGAALLLTSVMAAQQVPLGYATDGRVAAELTLAADPYLRPVAGRETGFAIDAGPKWQLVDRVLERLRAAPDVRAAAAAFTAPLTGAPNRGIRIDDAPDVPGAGPNADFQVVTADYFRALGIPLRAGRLLHDADREDAPRVAVVNETFGRRYLAGRDPLGHTVTMGGDRTHVIVGVVGDARYRSVEAAADPTIYLPLRQNDERWPFLTFVAWSDGPGAALGPVLREAVRQADPQQPITRIRTLDAIVAGALDGRRFASWLVIAFAAATLLLAAVGTYGVMAHAVAVRSRELALRSALGASPATLLRGLLGEGLRLAGLACLVGLAGAAAGAGVLRAALFEVSPWAPGPYAAVAALLLAVAVGACVPAARRAMRVAPTDALREVG